MVAQAFHWFDADAAFAEFLRVLRPGGRVGLIWNARDRTVDRVDQVWSVMDRVERRAPWRDHDRAGDEALGRRVGFGPLWRATFHPEHPPRSATSGRHELRIPYRVDCLCCERLQRLL